MKKKRGIGEDIPRAIAGLMDRLEKLNREAGGISTADVGGFGSIETVRAILNAFTDVAFLLDTRGCFVTVNDAGVNWFGKPEAELAGKSVGLFIPPELAEKRIKYFIDAVETGSPQRFEDNNRGRTFDNHFYPITGSDGSVAGVAIFARDITAERHEKETLARKTREIDHILNAIPDLYFLMDGNCVLLDYRVSDKSLMYCPPGEFLGKRIRDILPVDIGKTMEKTVRSVLRTKREKSFGYSLPLPDGTAWFEARILPADNGEVVAIVRDVTEMHKAEDSARASETRFQAIAAAIRDALVVVDDTGAVTFWNAAAQRMFGYSEKEIRGKKIHDLLAVDLDPAMIDGRFRTFAASGGGPVIGRTIELTVRPKNGELFPAELSISSFRMDGRYYAVGTIRDITARRRAEETIRASEEQYRLIVENQTDIIVRTDLEGRLTYVSPTYCHMFGKEEEDLIGTSYIPLIHEDDVAVVERALADLNRPPYTCYYEERALTADGWRWLGWAARAQFGQDGEIEAFVGTGRDITERKKAEEALRASEENFRLFYERAPSGYQSLDENGIIRQVNQAWLDTLGYEEKDVIGRWFGEFLASDQEVLFRDLFAHMMETGELHGAELMLRTRSGHPIAARFEGAVVTGANGEFIRAHAVFQDVTEERNARHILRVQRDLGIALGADNDIESALNHILDAAISLEGVDAGGIYLLDRDTGGLSLVAHRNLSLEYAEKVSSFGPDSDNVRVASTGGFFHIATSDLEKMIPTDIFRREGLRTISICPVIHEGRLAATMNIASRTVDELSVATRTALEDMAVRIGGVIARVRSDEMVLRAKNEWERTFDTIPDVVTILSTGHTILRANKAAAELFGVKPEDLVGRKCYEVFHKLGIPPDTCPHEKLLRDGREHHEEISEGSLGRMFWISDTPLTDKSGGLVGSVHVAREITETRRAEKAVRASEARYRAIVDNQPVAVCRWLPDTTLTYANEWYVRFVTHGDHKIIGESWLNWVPEEERDTVAAIYRDLAVKPRVFSYEHAVIGEEGEIRWFAWTDVPICDEKGNLVEFQSVGSDITERKAMEDALRASEQRFRDIFETVPVAIWEYDFGAAIGKLEHIRAKKLKNHRAYIDKHPDVFRDIIGSVRLRDVNRESLSLYGASSKEEILSLYENPPALELDAWREAIVAYLDGETGIVTETVNDTPDGRHLDVMVHVTFTEEMKKTGRALVSVLDITERKRAENAIRASEERYRDIYDNVPVAIFEYDFSETLCLLESIREKNHPDHYAFLKENTGIFERLLKTIRLRDMNNEALAIYGAPSKEAMLGATGGHRPEALEAWRKAMAAFLDGKNGLVTETVNNTFDGRPIDVVVSMMFTEEMKRTGRALVTALDITERKRAEQALLTSEERFRNIFETVHAAIWEYDFSAALEMVEDIRRRGITDYRAFFHENEDLVRKVIGTVRLCDANNEAVLLYGASSKEEFLTHYSGFKPETFDTWKEAILAFLDGEKSVTTESSYRTIDGRQLTVMISIAFTDEMMRTGRALVTGLDITERKRAEQAVIDTNRELDSVFRALPDLYFRMESDGTILNYRAGDDTQLLMPPEKFLGKRMQDVLPPEIGKRFESVLGDLRAGRRESAMEYSLELPSGERIFESRTLPLVEGQIFSMVRDITGRKLAEEALRESEERFRTIFENMAVPVAIIDTGGRWLQVNQRYLDLLGYSFDELHAMKNTDVTHPDDLELTRGYMKRLIEGESGHIRTEKRYIHRDGGIVWIDLSIASLRDARGEIAFFLAVSQDITERKQYELALARNEELLRTVVENAPVMLFSIDRDGVFNLSEGKGLSLLGLDPGQLTGESVFEVFRDNATVLEHMRRALSGEEHTGVVEIGGIVFETGYSPVFDSEGMVAGVIGISTDITRRTRAEQALRESEERYRRIVDTANEGMWLVNPDGNTTLVNVRMADMLGYNPADMIGYPVERFVFPDDIAVFREEFRKRELGSSGKYEMRCIRDDGEVRWFFVSASPITGREGRFAGSFAMFTDVTERKEAEAALRLSEERYKLALDAANEGLWDLHIPSGNNHYSPRYYTMLGYEPGEFPTSFEYWKTVMLHPDDAEKTIDNFERGMREKREFIDSEFRMKNKSGGWQWIVSRGKAVERDADGNIVRMVGTHTDITGRKQAEEALRESEKRFRAIFENSAVAIGMIDRSGYWKEANAAFESMVGYSMREIFGMTNVDLTHPDDREMTRTYIDALVRGEMESVRVEKRYIRKDGGIVWVDLSVTPIRNDEGDIVAFVGVKTDITERKRVETLLRESEERFAYAIDASNEGLWDWNVPTGEAYFSPRYYTMLGYEPNEFPSNAAVWESMIHPNDLKSVKRHLRHHFEGRTENYDTEFRMGTKSGGWVWIAANGKVVERDSSGKPVRMVGTHHDITRRKLAEEELRNSEERLATVFREIPTSVNIITIDDGRYLQVNEAFERILGWSPEEVLGRTTQELGIFLDDGDRNQIVEGIRTRGAVRNLEMNFRAKDGGVRDCFVSAVAIKYRENPCLLVVLNDISEHKREEENRKKLEAQLLQAQKMETVGRLAGGIAHDFNNLLTTIIGNAELSLMTLSVGEPVYEEMVEIKKSADRAASLTRQLLAFSRKQIVEPRVLNLNEVLLDMDKMLRRLIGEHIDYLTVPGKNLMRVKVDPGQVEQVITNLVVNSRDAMPQGGKITIETSNVTLDEEYTTTHPGSKTGMYVMLAVSDTGTGMDKEIREHIFEPFFTTKELGKGTGLGLPTCYGIVKQNRGTIEVYSEPGHGTTMKVYLPAIEEDAPAPTVRKAPDLPRGTETLLVVEDDSALREMVVRILGGSGYTVIAMNDGLQAIEKAPDIDRHVDMLLTDVVMPNMGGRDLANQIVGMFPDIKILFMSGYTDDAIVHHGVLEPGLDFIQKPFTPLGLLKKVREVLDKKR